MSAFTTLENRDSIGFVVRLLNLPIYIMAFKGGAFPKAFDDFGVGLHGGRRTLRFRTSEVGEPSATDLVDGEVTTLLVGDPPPRVSGDEVRLGVLARGRLVAAAAPLRSFLGLLGTAVAGLVGVPAATSETSRMSAAPSSRSEGEGSSAVVLATSTHASKSEAMRPRRSSHAPRVNICLQLLARMRTAPTASTSALTIASAGKIRRQRLGGRSEGIHAARSSSGRRRWGAKYCASGLRSLSSLWSWKWRNSAMSRPTTPTAPQKLRHSMVLGSSGSSSYSGSPTEAASSLSRCLTPLPGAARCSFGSCTGRSPSAIETGGGRAAGAGAVSGAVLATVVEVHCTQARERPRDDQWVSTRSRMVAARSCPTTKSIQASHPTERSRAKSAPHCVARCSAPQCGSASSATRARGLSGRGALPRVPSHTRRHHGM